MCEIEIPSKPQPEPLASLLTACSEEEPLWAGGSASNMSYLQKRQVGAAGRSLTSGWMKLCGGKLLNYLHGGQLISSPFY